MIKLLVYGVLSVHKEAWVQGVMLNYFRFFDEKMKLEFVKLVNLNLIG